MGRDRAGGFTEAELFAAEFSKRNKEQAGSNKNKYPSNSYSDDNKNRRDIKPSAREDRYYRESRKRSRSPEDVREKKRRGRDSPRYSPYRGNDSSSSNKCDQNGSFIERNYTDKEVDTDINNGMAKGPNDEWERSRSRDKRERSRDKRERSRDKRERSKDRRGRSKDRGRDRKDVSKDRTDDNRPKGRIKDDVNRRRDAKDDERERSPSLDRRDSNKQKDRTKDNDRTRRGDDSLDRYSIRSYSRSRSSSRGVKRSPRRRSRSRSRSPLPPTWAHDKFSTIVTDSPLPERGRGLNDYQPPSPTWVSRAGGVAIMRKKTSD